MRLELHAQRIELRLDQPGFESGGCELALLQPFLVGERKTETGDGRVEDHSEDGPEHRASNQNGAQRGFWRLGATECVNAEAVDQPENAADHEAGRNVNTQTANGAESFQREALGDKKNQRCEQSPVIPGYALLQ